MMEKGRKRQGWVVVEAEGKATIAGARRSEGTGMGRYVGRNVGYGMLRWALPLVLSTLLARRKQEKDSNKHTFGIISHKARVMNQPGRRNMELLDLRKKKVSAAVKGHNAKVGGIRSLRFADNITTLVLQQYPLAEVQLEGDGEGEGGGSKALFLEKVRQSNAACQSGDFETAVALYTEAIALDPHNHILYSNRSAAHIKLAKFAHALQDATKARELNPKWPKRLPRTLCRPCQLNINKNVKWWVARAARPGPSPTLSLPLSLTSSSHQLPTSSLLLFNSHLSFSSSA
ncbi:hypothetical protein Pcinc_041797 [Petrolisthes cinctipes]|uniref:Uncharacterized protein n=1 Tax=Petrolisthes cinctipes TaxID=88211 RepID=A0AAE1BK16_PETCI|nr:hypothetical protein Pcinc_041797 [Petrolisthes cinctipes]